MVNSEGSGFSYASIVHNKNVIYFNENAKTFNTPSRIMHNNIEIYKMHNENNYLISVLFYKLTIHVRIGHIFYEVSRKNKFFSCNKCYWI